MYYKITNIMLKRYQEINLEKTSIYKSPFKTFSFHSREYEVMAHVPKRPIMFTVGASHTIRDQCH